MDPTTHIDAERDFRSLFRDERLAMLRVAALLTGSVDIAEDVVQDAFVSVHDRWDQIERPGAYLRTTVVNGCRMVLRHRRVEERHRSGADLRAVEELPERLVDLRDAVSRLGERQRVVVVLRYFVDLPDHEIAEVLGCRPSTVRSLARRATAVLRKELE